jgi:nitrite reductase (NADH) small subunit
MTTLDRLDVPVVVADRWVPVCPLADLLPERGVAAVVSGHQVALVRTRAGELYAVGQRDPFSGAYVMSRGLVGSRTVGGEVRPVLQGPLFKQGFDLTTGACLDDPVAALSWWPVRERDGIVEVAARPLSPDRGP